jgi:hypothetical protein
MYEPEAVPDLIEPIREGLLDLGNWAATGFPLVRPTRLCRKRP